MTDSTSRRRSAAVLALALLGLGGLPALAAAGGANAEPGAPRATVQVGDLNLDSRAGVSTLYRRLAQAARAVCASLDGRTLREREAYAQCRRESLERAVRDVGHPALVALHGARTGNRSAG